MVKVVIKKNPLTKRTASSSKPEDDILSKLSSLKMSVGSGAVIYARQSDIMKHSLEDQVQKAKEYAKANGFKVLSVIKETCSGGDVVKQTKLMNALLEKFKRLCAFFMRSSIVVMRIAIRFTLSMRNWFHLSHYISRRLFVGLLMRKRRGKLSVVA